MSDPRQSTSTTGSLSHDLLEAVRTLARMARDEDLGPDGFTSRLLETDKDARFELLLKQPGHF